MNPNGLSQVHKNVSVNPAGKVTSRKLFLVCDAPEFQLYYSNQSGDCCSRCGGLTTCSGCLVPENFDIELKRYDHFKVCANENLHSNPSVGCNERNLGPTTNSDRP